jgi:DUF218 domain
MNSLFCDSVPEKTYASMLLFGILITFILIAFFSKLHEFLSKTNHISADTLVVEGWMPDYAIEAAVKEFKEGSYCRMITIGGPIQRGSYLFHFKSFAELAAATLVELGIESEKIVIASSRAASNHRTYDSALQLQQWLKTSNLQIDSFNLFTLGVHSRRSWILFRKVFKTQIKIGVIATMPLHYDYQKWWKSSEGARTVLSELIAYLYVRLSSFNVV